MISIYKKEMLAYFANMIGYIFLFFMLLVMGIYFYMFNVLRRDPNFQGALSNTSILFLILMPALTMRLFSEEARNKTDQLLFTSPLSIIQIVMGKFLAAVTLFFSGIVISMLFPLMISNYGTLPMSQIVGSYIGFALIGICCIAVGMFISVLTDNQIVAAIAAFASLFVMFIMDGIALSMPTSTMASLMFVAAVIAIIALIWYNSTKNIAAAIIIAVLGISAAAGLYVINNLIYDGIIVRALRWFSIYARFTSLALGIFNLSDVIYYLSFSALFIYLTVNIIEKRRWR
ncbi:MAG: ABC transporter permease [Defluviitaleaceae bacterium]|nr:ABC transporter permease [Defluviitaleaceae bacterium]